VFSTLPKASDCESDALNLKSGAPDFKSHAYGCGVKGFSTTMGGASIVLWAVSNEWNGVINE
jgi:hypothetical protein